MSTRSENRQQLDGADGTRKRNVVPPQPDAAKRWVASLSTIDGPFRIRPLHLMVQMVGCYALCATVVYGSLWIGWLQMDDKQLRSCGRAFLLEAWHGINGCIVKEAGLWGFSLLDSCVIHTLLFLNDTCYFRTPAAWEIAVFVVLRVVAEHLPTSCGGLMEIKRKTAAENMSEARVAGGLPLEVFRKALAFALTVVASAGLLLREHVFDKVFLLSILWAFPMTLLVAYYFLFTKETWCFLLGHMADMVSINPALVAAVVGFTSEHHSILG